MITMTFVMITMLSLQALLYQQDNETVFTVEYDIAKQVKPYLIILLSFFKFSTCDSVMILIINFMFILCSKSIK